jgi:hypothetical protein
VGILIGVVLLLLLIGMVVLQGMIEWGGFDIGNMINFSKSKDAPADKEELKDAAKPLAGVKAKKAAKKTAGKSSKKSAKKKGAK